MEPFLAEIRSFSFDRGFAGGIRVATGDVNGDAQHDKWVTLET